jgi:hypothetical protein
VPVAAAIRTPSDEQATASKFTLLPTLVGENHDAPELTEMAIVPFPSTATNFDPSAEEATEFQR